MSDEHGMFIEFDGANELKLCPFCGHRALRYRHMSGGHGVICGGRPSCRASVGMYGGGAFDSEEKATGAWNARGDA